MKTYLFGSQLGKRYVDLTDETLTIRTKRKTLSSFDIEDVEAVFLTHPSKEVKGYVYFSLDGTIPKEMVIQKEVFYYTEEQKDEVFEVLEEFEGLVSEIPISEEPSKGETVFEEKFGLFPKTKVAFDGKTLFLGSSKIKKEAIKEAYTRDPNPVENGYVYFSTDGTPPTSNVSIVKDGFFYTKGQQQAVDKLLELIDPGAIKTGNHITEEKQKKKVQKESRKNTVKCPQCDSKNVNFLGNNKKGFSVGKAVAGAALTGGIGTLAGFAGKKGKKNKWHCNDCGYVFNK
jgi:DNA-directed RNA polymerase subunit M/transcription elongation factor TFIIS